MYHLKLKVIILKSINSIILFIIIIFHLLIYIIIIIISIVIEYAKWLGMELDSDQDLFWVAREGLMAPLPKNWKPCKTKDTEDIYYFNFATGDSTWDHPCDGYYKRLYEEEKKKKETNAKESGDQNRTKAKADVEQLLGRSYSSIYLITLTILNLSIKTNNVCIYI